MAERIGKSCREKQVEVVSLRFGVSCMAFIRFWVLQVDWLVGDVQVPADQDGFFLVQALAVRPELFVPFLPDIDSRKFVLAVGRVAADEKEGREFTGYRATLVIQLGSDSVADITLVRTAVPEYPFRSA